MKIVVLAQVFMLLISCQTSKTVTGNYQLPSSAWPINKTWVEVAGDSTFEFRTQVGCWPATKLYSTGRWTVNDGYLILNSTYQPHDTLEGLVYGLEEYPVKYRFFPDYAFAIKKNRLIDTAEKADGKSIFKRLK